MGITPAQVRQWLVRGFALVRSQEMWLLLPISLIGGALWIFAELTDDVLEGDTHAFDRAVLLALRHPEDIATPIGPVWLQEVARDITSLGGTTWLTLLTIASVGFLLLIRKRATALLVAGSIAGGALLSSTLKFAFDRTRPDVVPHAVEVYSASFPSGHAMLSTVTHRCSRGVVCGSGLGVALRLRRALASAQRHRGVRLSSASIGPSFQNL